MRSKKVTLSIPHRYWEGLEKLAPLVGYQDARALLTWSPLYAFTVPDKPHTVTAAIAEAPAEVQDEFIEKIVGAFERGEIRHGSFFEALLADVAQRLGITAPLDVVRAVVSDTVRNRRGKKPPASP